MSELEPGFYYKRTVSQSWFTAGNYYRIGMNHMGEIYCLDDDGDDTSVNAALFDLSTKCKHPPVDITGMWAKGKHDGCYIVRDKWYQIHYDVGFDYFFLDEDGDKNGSIGMLDLSNLRAENPQQTEAQRQVDELGEQIKALKEKQEALKMELSA